MLSREGHDCFVRALALRQVSVERIKVLDGPLDTAADHHRPSLPADLASGNHLLVEVVYHDLGFQPNCVIVALHVLAQFLLRPLGVELRIVFGLRNQLVIAGHRDVRLEHVKDEALLHRLLHCVDVEGTVLDLAFTVCGQRLAEHFQCFVLGRSGEREVAGVSQHLPRGHTLLERGVDRVLRVRPFFLVLVRIVTSTPKRLAHRRGGLSSLA